MPNATLVTKILAGQIRAAGRLMRLVDDNSPAAKSHLKELYPHTGNAYIIGITGNPGSGKSTLVNQLITHYRQNNMTVGCVAIDPTSPFSGGAILGDRVRMQNHALDDGVFIRSVATRGTLGGLSQSTPALVHILDAMGFDIIIIETVGVGQDEVDIVKIADTNVVLTVPGLGDDIQAEKAGLMEIADIFVINKAEKPGADKLNRELKFMQSLHEDELKGQWRAPIVRTTALNGDGIDELAAEIIRHKVWRTRNQPTQDRIRHQQRHIIKLLAQGSFLSRLEHQMTTQWWDDALQNIIDNISTPYDISEELLNRIYSDN